MIYHMTKIEPMTIEQIRHTVSQINWGYANSIGTESWERAGLILTWATERARLESFWHQCSGIECPHNHDWLAKILREIGWPEDEK